MREGWGGEGRKDVSVSLEGRRGEERRERQTDAGETEKIKHKMKERNAVDNK